MSTRKFGNLDSSCVLIDNINNSKKAKFSLSSITPSSTRVMTIPDTDITLVGQDNTQILTNKILIDNNTNIANISDNNKKVKFDCSNITSGATRTVTLPNESTTMVGTNATQTLTNKTITDSSNIVTASRLKTTGTDIIISSATPPTTGQVLPATSATVASWQTPSGGSGGTQYSDRQMASASNIATTTSQSYVDLANMELTTKNLGSYSTYIISFSAEVSNTSKNKEQWFLLDINGSDMNSTERTVSTDSSSRWYNCAMNYLVSGITTNTIIKVRWKTEGSTGQCGNRQLVINGVLDSNVL